MFEIAPDHAIGLYAGLLALPLALIATWPPRRAGNGARRVGPDRNVRSDSPRPHQHPSQRAPHGVAVPDERHGLHRPFVRIHLALVALRLSVAPHCDIDRLSRLDRDRPRLAGPGRAGDQAAGADRAWPGAGARAGRTASS